MTTNTITVPFHGSKLYIVEHNGEPYTPMKTIVEGMGLDWKSQYAKLKQRFASCVVEITMQLNGDNQKRSVVCLPVRKLFGWLSTISPNKVRPEIRETIITYQNECDDVLWQHWTKGGVASKTPKLTADQLRALQEAVQARANLLPPQLKGGAYPKLWGAVKSHFRVPSYRELPPEKFDDALSLIGRLPLEGELLSPGTDPAIAPAPRYHYPKSAITLAHVDAQPGWLTYQNLMDERSSHLLQDLLQQLSDQGHDVSGAILEYRAMLHVLEAQKFAMDSVEQSLARARQTGLRLTR